MSGKTDLFNSKNTAESETKGKDVPLSLRMRPRTLGEFLGQRHILGEGKLLRRLIDSDRINSLILYGPPGTGKSALAFIVSGITNSVFEYINATLSGVSELKKVTQQAKIRKQTNNKRTILFIDEIHRFNKAQQDVLLNDVELGNVIIIGATTHNPFFYINPALISRSQVFEFKTHSEADLMCLLKNAINDKERGLGNMPVVAEEEALRFLSKVSDGDARRVLNALEVGVLTTPEGKDGKIYFTQEVAQESIQKKIVRYDRDGDDHYDTISAFIKSMRGTDPDAALYWLAKMLYAGEDPRFIARRIVICAAEDVGNADPQALILANAAFQSVEYLGMPEARIPLAQATVYIACAPKSNAAYAALETATQDVSREVTEEVPQHLKDKSYKGAKQLQHGQGYQYSHDFKNHYVEQKYTHKSKKYYQPTLMGYEKKIREWLSQLKKE
ncbi:MAG: replication-associated recombination protein A [PVC group bacterium]|nr:replication-associated recombination protein A [PVC group bacterium]